MSHDTHRCAICAAEFESSADLVEHEKARHTQQGISGVNPGNEYPVQESDTSKPRAGREFTRRNFE
jgi:hypothetical protein